MVTVTARVTNTGTRPGSQVVQVYVRDAESTLVRPEKELRGFEKVHLGPGETTVVTVTLDHRSFAVWDVDTHDWQVEGGDFDILVGLSSRHVVGQATVSMASDWKPAPRPGPDVLAEPFDVDDATFAAMLGQPIPPARLERPFNRNSTIGDLGRTLLGRPVVKLMRAAARRIVSGADADGGLGVMVDHALTELPLRNLSPMTKGKVPPKVVAGLIRLANVATRSGSTPQ